MPKIHTKKTPTTQWPEMPIDPAWIHEGRPEARGIVLLQSADQLLSMGLWECTPGKFKWDFTWNEFVRVLEGEVSVTEVDGESYTLRTGDFAYFPNGLKTRWEVKKTVRKVFVLQTSEPFKI